MDKWGRRWILFETMLIGGLSCLSCIFVPAGASAWWTVGLAMIGKFQIACRWAGLGFGMVWNVMVWYGMVWSCLVCSDLVWYGLIWYVLIWCVLI